MIFVRDAMPSAWLDHADELRDAAERLWADRSNNLRIVSEDHLNAELAIETRVTKYYAVSRPYVLLAGLALENLLKGLLIARDPSLINTGKLVNRLRSHNLLTLAESVGDVLLDDGEHSFCRIATDAVPYWGRYPIPLAHTELLPEVGMNDRLHSAYLRLHNRLALRLYSSLKNGWNSLVGPQEVSIHSARYESRPTRHRAAKSKRDHRD